MRGDVVEAERRAEAALHLGHETGQPDALTMYSVQLGNIRYHQGRLHEIVADIEREMAHSPGLDGYLPVLAQARVLSGDLSGAAALLEGALANRFATTQENSWTLSHATWADVAIQLRNQEAAAVLRDLLAPYHAKLVTTHVTVHPAVSHYLGCLEHLLGRHAEADAWFAEAMQVHERFESPLLIAYTRAAWAALLADRGAGDDPARAREMAEQALAAATAGGYGYIERDAREVLERLG